MRLPKAIETSSVDKVYNRMWPQDTLRALETGLTTEEEELIRNGVPTRAMAEAGTRSMAWTMIIQAGMCSATYANDKFILQLTNSTIVAVLLSGFATAAIISPPDDFTESDVYSDTLCIVFEFSYFVSMLASAMYCFAATGIALHSVNRISNVLPSKSSVAYMTRQVFYEAREAMYDYVFKGMAFACGGIISAFVWINQNRYSGIPALVVSTLATLWFIVLYKKWDKMTDSHSHIGDGLCAKDMVAAAERKSSITEGLWTA